jgi:hypothetical protein
MTTKLILSAIFCALFTFSCNSQSNISELDYLEGTWKVENKDTYETWKKDNKTNFTGTSYKLKNDVKRVTETLAIILKDNKIIYQATVPNQNEGSTIDFVLNSTAKDMFSFENLEHDFPKKVQYKVIGQNKLLVNVFGENDQGFSYYLLRQ